jgi:hypothetical protein
VLLDGEDVREVGPDVEAELDLELDVADVAHDDVVLHPAADETLPGNREHVLRQPVPHRVAEIERCRKVLDLPGREEERPEPVHAQLEAGEETRVLGEEAARRLDEVAEVVADAERRPLEDRHGHGVTPRGRSALPTTARAR